MRSTEPGISTLLSVPIPSGFRVRGLRPRPGMTVVGATGLVPGVCVCKTRGHIDAENPMTLPLASRIALVTGASRGIGYATARALARAGGHVIAVARTQGGLEELDDEIRKEIGEGATLVPLALTDTDGIARLGAALHERHGKLDILVGNAGVP